MQPTSHIAAYYIFHGMAFTSTPAIRKIYMNRAVSYMKMAGAVLTYYARTNQFSIREGAY